MTTFADLISTSATLSATAAVKLSPASRATLSARAEFIPGRLTTLSATAGLSATVTASRRGLATLSATAGLVAYPSVIGVGLVPEYATSSVSLLPLESLGSDYNYAGSDLSRSSAIWLITAANEGPGALEFAFYEYVIVVGGWGASGEYNETVTDTVSLTDSMSFLREVEQVIYDAVVATDSFTTQADISVIISEIVNVISRISKDSSYETWVVNANTNASSRYENFNFNSLARWGNKFMGASADGIFILAGNTDNGTAIPAHILTGNTDLGSQYQKRIPFVYAGAQSDSGMVLLANTDAQQASEYTIPATTAMKTTRAILGKGLRGRYWQFKLSNSAGGDFTVDRLDAEFSELKRRI